MSGSASIASVLSRMSGTQQGLGIAGGATTRASSGREVGGASFASILADVSADTASTAPATTAAPLASIGGHAPHSPAKGTAAMFPITPGMTPKERAAVYVQRLTYAKAHGGLSAGQRAELAKYSAMLGTQSAGASAASKTTSTGIKSTAVAHTSTTGSAVTSTEATSTGAPASATAPGTTSQIDGRTYVNIGSYTGANGVYVPDGKWIDMSAPSSDTYGLLQQLLAVQKDPSLLQGSPLATHSMFSDPMERAANIAELGGSILANGPAYYGAYSGLSGAQLQQISEAAFTASGINLNPALAAAIAHAAAVTPVDAPATAPLSAASIAAAVANVSTITVGSYGSLSVSSLPAGTTPQYASSTTTATAGTTSAPSQA